jgi:hypothetical protein
MKFKVPFDLTKTRYKQFTGLVALSSDQLRISNSLGYDKLIPISMRIVRLLYVSASNGSGSILMKEKELLIKI